MAIITQTLKKETIRLLKENFDSSANKYYLGIGRSNTWDNATDTPPVTENTAVEERLYRNSLQSVKLISDASFIIPRNNWSANTHYSAYNDKQVGYPGNPYYVMNDENQVYICIQRAKSATGGEIASSIQPTGHLDGTTFRTSDDYAWKFLYSISAGDANKYIAANFLPVKLQGATTISSPAADIEQLAVQNAAVDGQIVGYEVVSGGSGYTSTPTLTIHGDGSGAVAIATRSGGEIVKVEVHDSAGSVSGVLKPAFPLGLGYTNASISQSAAGQTTDAVIRPIIGSKGGLGADPRNDLRSDGIMFSVKPSGDEVDGDFVIGNDFRQVGLIRNPLVSVGGSAFGDDTGNCLKKLVLVSKNGDFAVDETFSNTSGAKGIIDKISTNGLELFYHQDDETGYKTFSTSENITGATSSATGSTHGSTPNVSAEVETLTGDVLYIDNRAAVTRSADQTEDVKIVIQI